MDRPKNCDISCWIWYDKQTHEDLELWQNCLLAVFNAGTKRQLIQALATKMYIRLGGKFKALKPPRRKRRATVTPIRGARP